jgi:WD40 repeat protein
MVVATVGRSDRWLRLWDSTGEQIERPWPVGHVVSVAFGPHGGRVATGGTDGTVRVWNSETGEQIGSFQGSTGSVSSVAFSPDGRWIVAGGSDGTTRIWAVGSHQPLAVLRIHTDSVNSVAVTPDLRIVSGSDDQTAKIYSCDTCVSMREIEEMAERHLRLTDPGG